MKVYVFKTSVKAPSDLKRAEALLHSVLPRDTWNFDPEDCDNILRVESEYNIADTVCTYLSVDGIWCEELE